MPAATLANFVAYTLQIAAIVAIGAGLPVLLRFSSPKARLVYWRGLLVACLVLPLAQPLKPPTPPAAGVEVAFGSIAEVPEGAAPPGQPWPLGRTVGVILVLGIAGRLGWLGLGVMTLGRLRRSAPPLWPRPAAVDEASELVGADAEFRITPVVAHPVTFGETRPIVVVPEQFGSFADHQQKAVACHELVHVRRHDWLRTAADELVRSVFWFHPALWWLFDQIHLTREQVVDHEVVRLLGSRQPYLEALLRLAAPARRPILRPAPLFLTRAHLPQRIALLLKEVHMSRSRLVISFLAMAVVLLFGGRLVVGAFPLHAGATPSEARQAAQQAKPGQTAPGQQAARPGVPTQAPKPASARPPRKIHDVKPVYPPEAKEKGIAGTVVLEATMDAAGTVTDVKALKGHDLLVPAAIEAVRQWRFEPLPGTPKRIMTVTVRFRLDSGAKGKGVTGGVPGGVVGGVAGGVPGGVKGGVTGGVPGGVTGGVPGGVAGGVPGGVAGGVPGGVAGGVAGEAAKQPGATYPPDAVKVGGDVKQPRKILDVKPVYPEDARAAKVEGAVIIEAVIDTLGKVQDARILRSVPMLDQAAVDAVRQWRFEPVVIEGRPRPVIMTVTVNFRLQ
jgi:TonB family protein